ncbi:hypothetical protein LRP49_03915 [Enterovibrio sp. ZSDZ35]|uniref:Uncharacterized protein n=1 Tax=Enterovibrio qingdaonensis TaxID=2899818 RepID=A0ABT5QH86_9GAMM|nr:hypothetical protein [Enterovibrio sp. ZSDZ35]MDD1780341.1 hypothetical protein [Enterovibrio sp. ZSDZ35]
MKFAKFWAKEEFSVEEDLFGCERASVWGASNESEGDARQNAELRKKQLLSFADNGFTDKEEYEYFNGYIREDIIEEISAADGSVLGVITRNRYGALVLNTERAVFGDIDIPPVKVKRGFLSWFGKKAEPKDTAYYLARIEAYQKSNPAVSFRVYKTHSGIRFILTNQSYSPSDTSLLDMFKALNVDPLYIQLCKRQQCFRARLSPKPWRIGLLRPASYYPFETLDDERASRDWVREYDATSKAYSVVEHIGSFGDAHVLEEVQKLIDIHDKAALKKDVNLA